MLAELCWTVRKLSYGATGRTRFGKGDVMNLVNTSGDVSQPSPRLRALSQVENSVVCSRRTLDHISALVQFSANVRPIDRSIRRGTRSRPLARPHVLLTCSDSRPMLLFPMIPHARWLLRLSASIGSGSPRVMLGPAHVDVVPVTPDDTSQLPHTYGGWDEDPWSGAVRDGEVYGRGAVSD